MAQSVWAKKRVRVNLTSQVYEYLLKMRWKWRADNFDDVLRKIIRERIKFKKELKKKP